MTDRSSARARSIRPSATLELSARAKALAAAGEAVINLSAGEPDLPTPAPVVEAAHRALDQGHFYYTATPGIGPLREALAREYTRRLGIDLGPERIVVTNGAKQALFQALATVTDPGDRIGVLKPYWVTYAEQAHALGCEVVAVDCPAETQFRPDLDQLEGELRKGLRVLVVNSPSNPTGAAYGPEDYGAILERLEAYGTLLVSDEIYEDIVYIEPGHVSPLRLRPDLEDRICLISGFSKAFAMTGWRVGFSVAPTWWSQRMAALQGHLTSNVNAIAQQAALAAVGRSDLVRPMVDVFRQRRGRVLERLKAMSGLRAHAPEGAFYLYLDAADLLGDGGYAPNVEAFARRLLDDHRLVLVPGSAFGDDRHLRLSFAASDAQLEEGFDRLERALTVVR